VNVFVISVIGFFLQNCAIFLRQNYWVVWYYLRTWRVTLEYYWSYDVVALRTGKKPAGNWLVVISDSMWNCATVKTAYTVVADKIVHGNSFTFSWMTIFSTNCLALIHKSCQRQRTNITNFINLRRNDVMEYEVDLRFFCKSLSNVNTEYKTK